MRRRATVVGTGTMGAGIATLLARHGLAVSLLGRSADAAERGSGRVRDALALLGEAGDLTPADAGAAAARVHPSADLAAALRESDLVIEAVAEDAAVKRDVYRAIGAGAPASALVASTTSGLDVFALAPDFPGPGRLLIAHFWNPAYLVPLVEVVPGPRTSAGAVAETEALLRGWGCEPVTLRAYVPGFIGVRLNSALYREALHLIDQGVVDAAGIDAVMRESIALRLPVLDLLQVADFGGLDTFARVWEHMFPLLDRSLEPPPLVSRMVAEGRLGLKTGQGFHDHGGRPAAALLRERDLRLIRWRRERARYRLGGSDPSGRVPPAHQEATMRTKIAAPEFGLRTGAFSHACSVDLGPAVAIYTAGQLAVDPDGYLVGGADTARQAEFIYGVLERILAAAGATLDDIVKTTAYLTDIRDYPAVNEIRNRVFAGREPASTMVEVGKLVHPGARIEIEAVAIRSKTSS
jgi:3-hydroxybutyryl-CoA dehydrogenase